MEKGVCRRLDRLLVTLSAMYCCTPGRCMAIQRASKSNKRTARIMAIILPVLRTILCHFVNQGMFLVLLTYSYNGVTPAKFEAKPLQHSSPLSTFFQPPKLAPFRLPPSDFPTPYSPLPSFSRTTSGIKVPSSPSCPGLFSMNAQSALPSGAIANMVFSA